MTGFNLSDAILDVLLDAAEGKRPAFSSVEVAFRVGVPMEVMHYVLGPLFEYGFLDATAPQGRLRLTEAGREAALKLRQSEAG